MNSRAPHGARGLKSQMDNIPALDKMSRPVWGAWIEIVPQNLQIRLMLCRAPYGARGLKSDGQQRLHRYYGSRPVWGAWIEMFTMELSNRFFPVAPRMGRVD